MRILILTPTFYPDVGGVETHLSDLCDGLNKRKIQIDVLTHNPITISAKAPLFEKNKNVSVYRLPWPGFNLFHKFESLPPIVNFLYLTPSLFFLSFLFLCRNRKNIDVIHAHGIAASFAGVFLKAIFKIPLVISTHAIYNFNKKSLFAKSVREIFNYADKIIALSEKSKNELIKIGITRKKVGRYIYWVNQKKFRSMDKKECRTILRLEGKFTVLFVGRLLEIKGVKVIIRVAEKIGEKINFLFVGTGPLEQELIIAAKTHSNIRFAGKVDNVNLPIYFNCADLFVIPSLYAEGFGRVILESLSCGLPVIGSNMGSIPEALGKETGILIKPTADNFKREILSLFHKPKELKSMSQKAFVFAHENYSEQNIEGIISTYKSVIKNK